MAKRLSIDDKKNILKDFSSGETVNELAKKFGFTKLTIIRNLKKNIGENQYIKLSKKNSSLNQIDTKKLNKNNKLLHKEIKKESLKQELNNISNINEKKSESDFLPPDSFLEITPLNYEIGSSPRKELSSVPLSQINFPKIVYMIVHKNIELETKLLKDYPEWDFLPNNDLNRKTIEIFNDMKVAKRFCNKDQKVIKVPNSDVFRIVAPILISRGISRIVSSEQLIAL